MQQTMGKPLTSEEGFLSSCQFQQGRCIKEAPRKASTEENVAIVCLQLAH